MRFLEAEKKFTNSQKKLLQILILCESEKEMFSGIFISLLPVLVSLCKNDEKSAENDEKSVKSRTNLYKTGVKWYKNEETFCPTNFHLYHYAGNNPIKYTDPTGNDIVNNTDGYITARLEDSIKIEVAGKEVEIDTLIIAPHQTVKGTFDGARDENGNYYKVSAHAPFKVNFEINDKGMKIKGLLSKLINLACDLLKGGDKIKSGFKEKDSADANRLSKAWDKRIQQDLKTETPQEAYDNDEQKVLRKKLDPKQFKKEEVDNNEN